MHVKVEVYVQFEFKDVTGIDNLEYLGIDVRMILKMDLNEIAHNVVD